MYIEVLKNDDDSLKSPIICYPSNIDNDLKAMYNTVRDFLIHTLDSPYYRCTSKGGGYMLEIEYIHPKNEVNSITISQYNTEYKFQFKFCNLRKYDAEEYRSQYDKNIHGCVLIDEDLNIVSFTRDKIEKPVSSINNCITTSSKYECAHTAATSVRRVTNPFDNRCQQEVPVDNSQVADSDTTTQDYVDPINLSDNSFSVNEGTIDISDPSMEIATVDGSSFFIDEEKQRKRDEFLKNMSRKISKRNSDKNNNPK